MKLELLHDLRKDIVDLNQLKRKIDCIVKGREHKLEVISALDPSEVFTRRLFLPLKRKGAVLKALPFQLETILPFTGEYSVTLPLVQREGGGSYVRLYSFLNETMEEHVENIKTFGFTPDCVSTVARGLIRFSKLFAAEEKSGLIFHLGWARSYLVCFQEDRELYSATFRVGLKHFIDGLREDLSPGEEMNLNLLEGAIEECVRREEKKSKLGEILFELRRQVYRVLEHLKRHEAAPPEGLLLTGYAETLQHISKWMEGLPEKSATIFPHLEYETKELAAYAIEIGLAIDGLQRDEKSVQLLVGRFAPKRMVQSVKKKLKSFAALSCLCFFVGMSVVTAYFIKKETSFKQRFTKIVQLSGANEQDFSFLKKRFVKKEELSCGVAKLVRGLKNAKKEHLLAKPSLTVTEAFEWLLPQLDREISIGRLDYKLLSYPTVEHSDREFGLRVEIQFFVPEKEIAQNFFERLKQNGEGLIEDSVLSGEGNEYRADFTFKVSS